MAPAEDGPADPRATGGLKNLHTDDIGAGRHDQNNQRKKSKLQEMEL